MKEVIAHFGLDDKATEVDILNKVQELENSVRDLTAEKDAAVEAKNDLEAKNEDLGNKVIEANKQLAETLIDNAIKEGKLKKEAKNDLMEKSEGNIDMIRTLINSIGEPKVKLSDLINDKKEDAPKMSYRELEKNNPAKLEDIKNSNPELYKKLYREEYGVEIVLD